MLLYGKHKFRWRGKAKTKAVVGVVGVVGVVVVGLVLVGVVVVCMS